MLSALRYEQLSSMYFREIEVPRPCKPRSAYNSNCHLLIDGSQLLVDNWPPLKQRFTYLQAHNQRSMNITWLVSLP